MALVAIPNIPAYAFVPTLFTSVAQGEVPASGGGTANFLRADGAWSTPGGNPRVFISELTGTGPWSWTGLNGDATGVRGYEIVFRITKAAAAAHTFGIQFNADTGGRYVNAGGGGLTSGPFVNPAGLGVAGEVVSGSIFIAAARSGAVRQVTSLYNVYESATPSSATVAYGSAWEGVGNPAITRIDVIVATGTVDAGTLALYKLMDVP